MDTVDRGTLNGRNETERTLRLIDEIEQLVERGWSVLGQNFVSEEEFYLLTTRLRSALPMCLRQAEALLRQQEEIIRGAITESHQICSSAQEQANHQIATARQQAIERVKVAEAKREQILTAAVSEAQRITTEAQRQAEELIARHYLRLEAETVAANLRKASEAEAHEMRIGAQEYAHGILSSAEDYLGKLNDRVARDQALIPVASHDDHSIAEEGNRVAAPAA